MPAEAVEGPRKGLSARLIPQPRPLLRHGLSQNQTMELGVGRICSKAPVRDLVEARIQP